MEVINQKTDNENYWIYNADTVEVAQSLPSDSVDFSVFSPPFASLYTYSNSDRDMGNVKDDEEFWEQYRFLIKEQFRVMKPGRNLAIHCMNLPTSKQNDGFIGVKDFRAVILFYDPAVLDRFVTNGWDFGAQADAALKGSDKGGAASESGTLRESMDIYQFTETGVFLRAAIEGTRYWPDKELN